MSEGTPGLAPWIIAVICVCAVLLFGTVAWLVYAFTHPNSKAGLWLIQVCKYYPCAEFYLPQDHMCMIGEQIQIRLLLRLT